MALWQTVRRALMRPGREADEVRRELQAHVAQEIEEHLADGQSPQAARHAALRTVGNLTLIEEQVRDLSPWVWWDRVRQDVRYALRSFRRQPAFSITAVLTLGLGIGANGAIFSVVDALVLRSLPVQHPEELVVIRDAENGNHSYPDYIALRDNDKLTVLFAASSLLRETVVAGGEAETVPVRLVTANYFTALGVVPAAGRLMGGSDTASEAVISDGYWMRRFGRSPDVLGRPIRVNGVDLVIVGVSARGFFGETPGESPDVFASMAVQRPQWLNERGFSWLYLMGRLKRGVSVAEAQSSVSARVAAAAGPDVKNAATRTVVMAGTSGNPRWRERVGSPLWIMTAVVGIVLLIACANLATLLLTRGAARQHEIAMRMAIGASRARIVRQLLTEALVLSAMGGAVSLLFAAWGGRLLVGMASSIGTGPQLQLDVAVDTRLLLFTSVVSLVAGLLFGLLPSIREGSEAGRHLASSQSRIVGTNRSWGLRGALIAGQAALSLVLVAGSIMFLRTLRNLETQPLGFRTEGLLRVEIEPERGYEPPPATALRLIERLAAIPGVDSATTVGFGTLSNRGGVTGLQIDGFTPRDAQDQRSRADWVGPDYLRVAGVRLVGGREFSKRDDAAAPLVAIVNQAAARFYFGSDAAALGRRFTFNQREYEIVGIAGNAKYAELREPTLRMIYFSTLQRPGGFNAIELRSSPREIATLVPTVRAAVREVDPRLTVADARTLAQRVTETLGREHLVASLSSVFGGLTLLLVSVGIYGSLAFIVGQRTRELGVRLALGSRRTGVVWLVVRDVLATVLVGAAIGTAAAIGAARLVRSLLFGLEPADPITLAIAAGLLLTVALVAGLLPALRAASLDPAEVLRE